MPERNISRRVFLGQTLASVLALPARGEAQSFQDGFRILEAREGKLQLLPEPAIPTAVWGYAGAVPGPLLRFKKGEEVKIRLVNKLPQPTSLNWHGVRIANPMDGVAGLTQQPVPPGGTFDYRFTPPDSGLYWYHPPMLPFFDEQLARGLYGVLIVDEPQPPAADRDMLVLLDDWQLGENGRIKKFEPRAAAMRADGTNPNFRRDIAPAVMAGPRVKPGDDPAIQTPPTGVWMPGATPGLDPGAGMTARVADHEGKTFVTVNARSVPIEEVLPPSSRLRLRIVNACNQQLRVIAFAGVTPFVVAIDSQPCEAFEPAKWMIPLAPGARFDVMADLPSDPGAGASLKLLGGNEPGRVLLAFKTAGNPRAFLPPIASLPQNPLLPTQIKLEASQKFNIAIEAVASAGSQPAQASSQAPPAVFMLNGKVYDGFAAPPLFSVNRGMPVTLGVTNRTKIVQAIHVHGHAMRLLHNLDDGWEPYWRDTFVIAEGKSKHVAFVADNPGKWAIERLMTGSQRPAMSTWFEVT